MSERFGRLSASRMVEAAGLLRSLRELWRPRESNPILPSWEKGGVARLSQ
jgi:hypothetical protein